MYIIWISKPETMPYLINQYVKERYRNTNALWAGLPGTAAVALLRCQVSGNRSKDSQKLRNKKYLDYFFENAGIALAAGTPSSFLK
jgi:hypothetical protein